LLARLVLAVVLQALLAAWFAWQGNPDPWRAAAPWWIVYGSLIDIGCLGLLWWLTKREGIRLFDLVGFQRRYLWRDVLIALGFILLIGVLAFVTAELVFGPLIYGAETAPLPMSPLPLWGALYALLVWPVVWAIAEDTTYLGYALPRIEVLFGNRWSALMLVNAGWAIQHVALPIVDLQWALYRLASVLVIGVVWTLAYLMIRRLLPFFLSHWAFNFLAVLAFVLLPLWSS
jgi:membrane protease YdiL (CAAX protease family)